MTRKILSVLLAILMLLCVFGCKKAEKGPAQIEAKGYTFGAGKTFHSDEPVEYSMYFSDAAWYPKTDKWESEGIFAQITKRTNVKLNITSFDSGDYTNKITLDINAGNSCYIIPKVYDESAFVDGGAIVPVSDYVQYMPNYLDFYNKYNMAADVATITRANGKYYRLPGMLEAAMQDYTFIIRKDLFDAAGVNVKEEEKNWTWDSLYDALTKVKTYMVSKGIIDATDYVWSDLWCGAQSGQGKGGNLVKLIGASYGVPAGWAISNGMQYDHEKKEWYFASGSEDFKEMVTVLNKFVKGGILDPETFTQDDATANNKFYNGETAILSMNRGTYAGILTGLDTGVGAGNYETYITVGPIGKNRFTAENSRLENGVMVAKKALDELGEEGFVKMIRFIDWLWYSDEAYDLYKWGVEGETYQKVTDPATGLTIKKLMPGYKCGGLGISGADTDVDIRLEWGYAGGNLWYGHTVAQMSDNFIPVIQDYYARLADYRETSPVNPAIASTEDENEQIKLWATPLTDNINAWTLQFIVGQKDINKDWDAYISSCKNLNSDKLLNLINEISKR